MPSKPFSAFRAFPRHAWGRLVDELDAFSTLLRQRGIDYATTGRVGSLEMNGESVRAEVTGHGDEYDTEWEWQGGSWRARCTCPVAPRCKHAYALGAVILHQASSDGLVTDPRFSRLLPTFVPGPDDGFDAADPPQEPPPRTRGRRAAPLPSLSRPSWSPNARTSSPASGDTRQPTARRLMAATQPWERWQMLHDILADSPIPSGRLLTPTVAEIMRDPDAELMCWRLARFVSERTNGWLPPALEAFRERPDLAQRFAEVALPEVERELLAWAQTRRATGARSLRIVFSLVTEPAGGVNVAYDVRLTSSRLVDDSRNHTQLEQLQAEVRRKPGSLSPEHTVLLEAALAARDLDAYTGVSADTGLSSSGLRLLLERSAGRSEVTWAEDLDAILAARYGVTPGSVVRWNPQPARVLPTFVSVDGEPVVTFRAVLPDGREHALDDVCYLRTPDDYYRRHRGVLLAEGEFFPVGEEPPPTVLASMAEIGAIPLPAADRGRFLGSLADAFPSVRASIAPHVRRHPVTLAMSMRLLPDDWMQLRLFAHTAGGAWKPGDRVARPAVVFEYSPDERWEDTPESRAPGLDVMAVPDTPGAGGDAADGGAPTGRAASSTPGASADGDGALTGSGTSLSQHTSGSDDDSSTGPGASSLQHTSAPADALAASDPTGRAASSLPSDADADIWLEEPDPDLTTPLVEWLRSTEARSGELGTRGGHRPSAMDAHVGWWLRLGAKTAQRLAEAWDHRPPGVKWFGNGAAAALLSGQRRVTAKLRVRPSGVDWFAVSAEWESETTALTDADLARLRGATTRWVKLSSGWTRKDSVELVDKTAEVLADLGIEPGAGEQRLGLWQLAQARPESLAELELMGADVSAVEDLRRLRERVATFAGVPACPVPDGFRGELRPYQQHGLDFLAYTSSLGLGSILADDMGLGKTVQALAWILHLRRAGGERRPSLVVCPASVVHNWEREAQRFAPELRVLTLTSGQERHASRKDIANHDLLVTNYALLRRDLAAWRDTELLAAILDEAQNIKNPDAVVSQASLELRARHRLALTGTPLENRALDLWSIMAFVNPGYLGDRREFALRYDRPDAPPHARALLAAKLRPVLLRRLKREVAPELPDRIEERRDCVMSPGQRKLYAAELELARRAILKLAADPQALQQNRFAILASLTRLRQICCHPRLVGGSPAAGSGKFDALFELLEPLLAEGHKVLLFSQFVECLELLRGEMTERAIPQHWLTGDTRHRDRVVSDFETDPNASVFLISLKAGGTGLNLTAASYVVLFDPWWNPAVEAQAIDRAHRIGQTRTVIAYRLLSEGTIEQKIWELQQKKAALVRDVLGEDGFARSLDREALEYLLAEV